MMTPTFLPASAPFWPLAPSAPVTKTAAATTSAASETQRDVLRLMLLRPFRRTIDERSQSGWCVSPGTRLDRAGTDWLGNADNAYVVIQPRAKAVSNVRRRRRARRSGRGAAASVSRWTSADREDAPARRELVAPTSIRSSRSFAAARPISASGWRTVVRLKPSQPAMSMSSKPTIESSAGTRTPTRRAASSAPNAITSFAAKTAVGRGSAASRSRHHW